MNILDIILLLCLVPAVIQGLRKGFISQAVAIISIVLGGWIAYNFASAVAGWLKQWIDSAGPVLEIIAFILIFAIVICVLMLVGKLLEATVKIILLGWLNKVLGLIFALFKYIMIIGLVIVFFYMLNSNLNIVSEKFLDNSILYTGIKRTAYSIFPYFKELLF